MKLSGLTLSVVALRGAVLLTISLTLAYSGCRTLKLASPPLDLRLRPLGASVNNLELHRHAGAGRWTKLPRQGRIFLAKFPRMGGGYSEFLGFYKYNVSDPWKYRVLSLRIGKKETRTFSILEATALPRDESGAYMFRVPGSGKNAIRIRETTQPTVENRLVAAANIFPRERKIAGLGVKKQISGILIISDPGDASAGSRRVTAFIGTRLRLNGKLYEVTDIRAGNSMKGSVVLEKLKAE